MSALPPIATAKADSRKSSCLLYPQKQTCGESAGVCEVTVRPDVRNDSANGAEKLRTTRELLARFDWKFRGEAAWFLGELRIRSHAVVVTLKGRRTSIPDR